MWSAIRCVCGGTNQCGNCGTKLHLNDGPRMDICRSLRYQTTGTLQISGRRVLATQDMADTDRWNSVEAYEVDVVELWSLSLIFESPSKDVDWDTKYSDVSVTIINNWKVVKFELGRWDQKMEYWRMGVDLFAVIK